MQYFNNDGKKYIVVRRDTLPAELIENIRYTMPIKEVVYVLLKIE